jgi:hypothetical protein
VDGRQTLSPTAGRRAVERALDLACQRFQEGDRNGGLVQLGQAVLIAAGPYGDYMSIDLYERVRKTIRAGWETEGERAVGG